MIDAVKKRIGKVLVGVVPVVTGHMAATQWLARGIGYDERFLGPEVFFDDKIDVKFYWPHKVWEWSHAYWGGYIDELIMQAVAIALVGAVLGAVLALVFGRAGGAGGHRTAHGSARWASEQEVRASDMVLTVEARRARALEQGAPEDEACSVVVGKLSDGTLLMNSGPEHILGNAPTRSGKGVGWVLPTLLTWVGSVVVTDIKGENFQITGWWRSLFSHVIYFNPTDANSARWNPLLELRRGDEAIQDAMNLAEILGSGEGGGGSEFWENGAKKFLYATILYVLYTQEDKSLGKCIKLLARFEETFEAFAVVSIPEAPRVEETIRSVATAAQGFSDSVRGGWAAGAESALNLWRDPKVAQNTSRSDFRLRDLQYARRPVSLYLVIPPPDIERLAPLVRLFFQQATDALTSRGVEAKGGRHRLLMMMDEFPAFGPMNKIQKAIAYTAGYGIKWFFIVQGLNQLADRKLYGPENAFLSNCHTRLAYRCNDPDNAKSLSEMMGKTTGFKAQEGESGKKGVLSSLSNRSVSQVEYERDLMTPGELQQMDSCRVLVMNAGENPIRAYKVTYYDDPNFIPRYAGKRWGFPEAPLADFPAQDPRENPWRGVLDPELNDGDLRENMLELEVAVGHGRHTATGGRPGADAEWVEGIPDPAVREELRSGEAPEPLTLDKVPSTQVDALTQEIPPGMGPREANLHVTTSSLRSEDIDAMLERAVRAGLLTREGLKAMRRVTAGAPTVETGPPASPHTPPQGELPDDVVELDDEDDEERFVPPDDDEDDAEVVVSDFAAFDDDDLAAGTNALAARQAHGSPTSEAGAHDDELAGVGEDDGAPELSTLEAMFMQMGIAAAEQDGQADEGGSAPASLGAVGTQTHDPARDEDAGDEDADAPGATGALDPPRTEPVEARAGALDAVPGGADELEVMMMGTVRISDMQAHLRGLGVEPEGEDRTETEHANDDDSSHGEEEAI